MQGKAFAPIKSQLFIQQSTTGANVVNAVLKPRKAVKAHSVPIKYIIIRGLDKNSFIIKDNSNKDIIVPSSGGSELIQKFWVDFNDAQSKFPTKNLTPDVRMLGFDNNTIADTESIRSIFMGGHDVRAISVEEGMWIGNFVGTPSVKAGIDIVLADNNYIPSLSLARTGNHIIDIDTATGFEEKKIREQVLAFIDAAAFYGFISYDGRKNQWHIQ